MNFLKKRKLYYAYVNRLIKQYFEQKKWENYDISRFENFEPPEGMKESGSVFRKGLNIQKSNKKASIS